MLKGRKVALVVFGLIIVLLLTLGACGGSAPKDSGTTSQQPASTETKSEAPAGNEKVKLTFWMSGSATLDAAMDDILAEYMAENPNVEVVRESFPFVEYFQKLFTAFSGGAAPDVFWIDVRTAAFANQGMLLPLDKYITEENRSDVIESAWKEAMWQGTTYSVPLHQLTDALYVNTKMAADAGIEVPTKLADAWTWEEMNEITSALTVRQGDQTTVWGFGQGRHLQDWPLTAMMYQGGGAPINPELNKTTGYINSPESVAGITWLTNLVKESHVMPAEPIPDGFGTGQVAIFQDASTFRAVVNKNFPDLEYTVAPVYVGPAGCAVVSGGWNVAIANNSKNPDAAWDLVDWMTRERHLEWVEKSGYLPIRKSVIANPEFSEYPWTVFLEQLQNCSVTRPPIPEYQLYNDLLNAAGIDIAVGADAQATLDGVATSLDQEIAKRK